MDEESFYTKMKRLGLWDKPISEVANFIDEKDKEIEKYMELLHAVESKHPGESRHETALRYIREAEHSTMGPQEGEEDGDDSAMEDLRQPSGGGD